jgi:hypothetical protein
MREKQFHEANPRKNDSLHDFENDVLGADSISHEQIRQYAATLAEELAPVLAEASNEADKHALLLNFLHAQRMISFVDAVYGEKLSIEEIEPHLRPLRQALLRELQSRLGIDIHAIISGGGSTIMRLEDGKIAKETYITYTRQFAEQARRDHLRALHTLYSLPESERSPYLAYQLIDSGPYNNQPMVHLEVQQQLPIQDLANFLRKNRPGFAQALGYVVDAMQGAQFLLDHGLRLTDLHLQNIAVDTTSGRGLLFDYDGLRSEDDVVHEYYAAYRPPEVRPSDSGPIEEAHMVYELGKTLQELFKEGLFNFENDDHTYEAVDSIRESMVATDPQSRPSLKEVIASLQSFI